MKFIYTAIVALCCGTGFGYDTLAPQYYGQVVIVHQVPQPVQIMVYNSPYFTVTVPVPVIAPVTVAQPATQTVYWGYPYQPVAIYNNYWNNNRCRLFNFNY